MPARSAEHSYGSIHKLAPSNGYSSEWHPQVSIPESSKPLLPPLYQSAAAKCLALVHPTVHRVAFVQTGCATSPLFASLYEVDDLPAYCAILLRTPELFE